MSERDDNGIRDQARDEGRDLERDPHRDDARDLERDDARDGPRDEERDAGADRSLDRKTYFDGLTIITVPLLFVVIALGGAGWWTLERANDRDDRENQAFAARLVKERQETTYGLCKIVQENRAAIRAAIAGGDPLLLKPGDYGYTYAQEHPAEARRQSEKLREQRKNSTGPFAIFPQVECSKPGGKPEENGESPP